MIEFADRFISDDLLKRRITLWEINCLDRFKEIERERARESPDKAPVLDERPNMTE